MQFDEYKTIQVLTDGTLVKELPNGHLILVKDDIVTAMINPSAIAKLKL